MSEGAEIGTLLRRVAETMRPASPPDPVAVIEQAHRERRRRRRIATAATCCAVAALIPLTVMTVGRGAGRSSARVAASPASAAASTVSARQLAGYRWSQLPTAPIRGRTFGASVWTGTEMIVWGGAEPSGAVRRDGAAFDPRTDRWRVLSRAPLTARSQPVAVWTGSEMIVWGGQDARGRPLGDGAAYDPRHDSWRTIASSPVAARRAASAVWTQGRMIVVGGKARGSRVLLSTAEYDPGADEWSTLPSVPARAHRIVALVASGAGSHVYVWNVWGSDATGAAGIDLLAYDATAQTWRAVPASPGAPRGVADAFWTGDELIVPPARPWPGDFGNLTVLPDLPGARYTPATHTWHGIPPGPLGDGVGRDVWTGGALVRLTNAIGGMSAPGAAVVWDPHSGAWLQLPRQSPVMSMSGDATVWTGRELLVWGDVMGADAVVGPPSSAPGTGGIRLRG